MNTTLLIALLVVSSLLELLVLGGVLFFYLRLKRSEKLMNTLQENQETLLARIEMNARLEQDVVSSFAERQAELGELNGKLEERAQSLRRLLEQAEGITRSPQFLREVILNGRRKGHSIQQIARKAGISVDEVELILTQNPPEE